MRLEYAPVKFEPLIDTPRDGVHTLEGDILLALKQVSEVDPQELHVLSNSDISAYIDGLASDF